MNLNEIGTTRNFNACKHSESWVLATMTGNSLTVATQQVHGGGLKERLDDSSRLPFKNDN
jgi:hypothetical protein